MIIWILLFKNFPYFGWFKLLFKKKKKKEIFATCKNENVVKSCILQGGILVVSKSANGQTNSHTRPMGAGPIGL